MVPSEALTSPALLSQRERREKKRQSGEFNGEAGYNMVVLIMAIAVLNILVAAMLPLWSTQIRREKEEELIFRGFQYAEAIRVFHNRFQRYPNRLEELLEIKPRTIRQLWKDPMTEDGKWGLMHPGPDGPLQVPPPGQPPMDQKGKASTEDEDENGRETQFGPKKGDTVEAGPIVGVRSKSHEKSMIVLFGRDHYDEWAFTEDLLTGVGGGGQVQKGGGGAITGIGPTGGGDFKFSTRWIGRPWRFQYQPPGPQDGTLPDGRKPNPRNTGGRQGPRSQRR